MPTTSRRRRRGGATGLLLCPILLVSSFQRRLLYAEDPAAAAFVLEYQLHNAPSRDYSGDERDKAAKEQPGSEYDEEQHIKPYFLLSENGPRVVQYYSPWCGHCQFFKTKYVSLAKEIAARLPDDQPEVNFHAVSCSAYHWVCMQNNIMGFPTVVAFKANSAVPHRLMEKGISAETIAEAVGVQLNDRSVVGEERIDREDGDIFSVIFFVYVVFSFCSLFLAGIAKGIFSVILENIVFLGFSAAVVIWCTRNQYISFTGRHKKDDNLMV